MIHVTDGACSCTMGVVQRGAATSVGVSCEVTEPMLVMDEGRLAFAGTSVELECTLAQNS